MKLNDNAYNVSPFSVKWIMSLKTDAYSFLMIFCKVVYRRSYQLLLSQITLDICQYSNKKKKSKILFLIKFSNMTPKNNA